MAKEISYKDYLCLLGLFEMSKQAMKQVKHIERSIAEMVHEPDEGYGYFGHVSDAVYTDDESVDNMLAKLEISVAKEPKKRGA